MSPFYLYNDQSMSDLHSNKRIPPCQAEFDPAQEKHISPFYQHNDQLISEHCSDILFHHSHLSRIQHRSNTCHPSTCTTTNQCLTSIPTNVFHHVKLSLIQHRRNTYRPSTSTMANQCLSTVQTFLFTIPI